MTTKVTRFLIPADADGPVDLEDTLVVVPTREAGRRLRESLAVACALRGTALLSAQVVPPAFFFAGDDAATEAGPTAVKAAWARVLLDADPAAYQGFLPAAAPDADLSWALHMGEMIERLRQALTDGGLRMADVPRIAGDDLEEPERWRDMAALESAYLSHMEQMKWVDPCTRRIQNASNPVIPDTVKRIVVASTPDPSPLMIRALELCSARRPIDILVWAPDSMADAFDEWGRPLPAAWQPAEIAIPDPDHTLFLAASPAAQSDKVVELMAAYASRFGPADIAIGVPDIAVIPYLQAALAAGGLPVFDPSDRPVSQHPLYLLLSAFGALLQEGTYDAFAALLRHADVLTLFRDEHGLSPLALLRDLDTFQNTFLPQRWEDIAGRLREAAAGSDPAAWADLRKAADIVGRFVDTFNRHDPERALRDWLQTVYASRSLSSRNRDDEDFAEVAREVDTVLRDFTLALAQAPGLDRHQALSLMLRSLSQQPYHRDSGNALLDLEGWLELPWNDAPILIVTGMNDGVVPGSRQADAFLPGSLASRLCLRDDDSRLARDAYLLRAMIESRASGGHVCLIAGKASQAGDPLKPSRLLFRCADEDLPARAARLFGPTPARLRSHPASISFKLNPSPPPDLSPGALQLTRLSVTAFRDYLACPFRFYLKRVLGMAPLDDGKRSLDALDFGNLIHVTLRHMAVNEQFRSTEDEALLSAFLSEQADQWVRERFGAALSLPLIVGLDAARQRLAAAARVQVELVRAGWEIVQWERTHETRIGGIGITGQVDRIDRHRESGRLRILDYKTSDRESDPAKAHLAFARADTPAYARVTVNGRESRWTDLQLPLYAALVAETGSAAEPLEVAYFNLPRATGETGVYAWTDFSDTLLASARRCAAEIVDRVQALEFWPPSESVRYDDFEALFPGRASEAFEALPPGHRQGDPT